MEKTNTEKKERNMTKVEVNPLRKEKIFVRFIPKKTNLDKRHPLFGGKADGARDIYCVPMLRSTGKYKNVLTNEEKDYLEKALQLDSNALSVYKPEDNYWDNYKVELTKEGLHLDLSDPEDYIKYKVLLANNDFVAASVQERIERPKESYRYEIVRESEETNLENIKMDLMMSSYKEFGKIEEDFDTLRVLIELLDVRPYSQTTKIEFLRSRANMLIQDNPKKFYQYITDPLLHSKVIIRRATELGKIAKKGDYYYLSSDGTPLCDAGQNPTLDMAAQYINLPSKQDIKFLLESEINNNRI